MRRIMWTSSPWGRKGDLRLCLLFIYDGCLRTQNNSYSLSILDQLLHHYLDDVGMMCLLHSSSEKWMLSKKRITVK